MPRKQVKAKKSEKPLSPTNAGEEKEHLADAARTLTKKLNLAMKKIAAKRQEIEAIMKEFEAEMRELETTKKKKA